MATDPEPGVVVASPGMAPRVPAPTGRPKIAPRLEVALVAGEAGSFRQLAVATLARSGVRTITADEGPTALDTARRARPRLIVVSHDLRGLSGPEVIQAVREDPALARTRVLLHGGPEASGRWSTPPQVLHGADAHVTEDVDPDHLADVLGMLLGLDGAPEPPEPPEEELRALGRLVVADLVARGLFEASRAADLEASLDDARAGCHSRYPLASLRPASLAAFEDEMRRASPPGFPSKP